MQVNGETIIGDILDNDDACAEIFLSMGMTCMGCPASRGETIREACEIHGIDEAELVQKLSAQLSK